MMSEPDAPADLVSRLRQQLILAQVRIMELEDTRDELVPRLAEVEKLLGAAQSLAELKVGEAAHLDQVRGELQTQYTHLQHIQHLTHAALEDTRTEVAAHCERIGSLLSEVEALHELSRQLAATGQVQLDRLARQESELSALREESATRLARISELDTEQRAMKGSRSWRWTAWLRSVERLLR